MEELHHAEMELNGPDGDDPVEVRKKLLEEVFNTLAAIRENIVKTLDGPIRLAFELGVIIDQGFRPPNVYRNLSFALGDRPPDHRNLNTSGFGGIISIGEVASLPRSPANEKWHLVEKYRQPGEVPPEEDWLFRLRSRWAEVGLRAEALVDAQAHTRLLISPVCGELSSAGESVSPSRKEAIEKLADAARGELLRLEGPTPSSMQTLTRFDSALPNESVHMTWQEAAEQMERLRAEGQAFSSQQKLADKFGCSSGTINKAIRQTPSLEAWAKRQTAAPRAQSINDVVTDRTAQSTEPNPEDNAAIREFIESADSETKAWFLGLPHEKQLEVVSDPDKHRKILKRNA
jgi:hypothetical protein